MHDALESEQLSWQDRRILPASTSNKPQAVPKRKYARPVLMRSSGAFLRASSCLIVFGIPRMRRNATSPHCIFQHRRPQTLCVGSFGFDGAERCYSILESRPRTSLAMLGLRTARRMSWYHPFSKSISDRAGTSKRSREALLLEASIAHTTPPVSLAKTRESPGRYRVQCSGGGLPGLTASSEVFRPSDTQV
ncbi:hypothetical protein BV20DRAFT_282324 [Pilatotrama ljubarskyi]|nr:hypothetical protein BV20DRAFT_282324 [Pilatotrama ljubarskyi]